MFEVWKIKDQVISIDPIAFVMSIIIITITVIMVFNSLYLYFYVKILERKKSKYNNIVKEINKNKEYSNTSISLTLENLSHVHGLLEDMMFRFIEDSRINMKKKKTIYTHFEQRILKIRKAINELTLFSNDSQKCLSSAKELSNGTIGNYCTLKLMKKALKGKKDREVKELLEVYIKNLEKRLE